MIKLKNEHVVPRKNGWAVRREGSEKVSKLFETQSDAMDYAGRIAKKDDVSMVVHKHNGEFKNFRHGFEIHVKKHNVYPPVEQIETVQLNVFPIVNNTQPIVQTITSD
ncbi:MAG: DUF2188 domain-containing protein [Candidatus Pacearchaeota archaeon]|jgi:hypothetical protein